MSNYSEHIAKLTDDYGAALSRVNSYTGAEIAAMQGATQIEAVLIHSGSERHYYADDRGIPFQAFGHLLHWLPVNRPDQFVYFCPGEKPTYFQIVPRDFWYDQSIELAEHVVEQFSLVRLSSVSELSSISAPLP